MRKQNEQLGLFEKAGEHFFRVRTGDTYLDRTPNLVKIDPNLYAVEDTTFETLKILKEATNVYRQIQVYRRNYEKALAEWESLTEGGNDGILPPPNVGHLALTPSEQKEGLKSLEGYEGWEKRAAAWDRLQKCITENRNGNRMLERCITYFQFKRDGCV